MTTRATLLLIAAVCWGAAIVLFQAEKAMAYSTTIAPPDLTPTIRPVPERPVEVVAPTPKPSKPKPTISKPKISKPTKTAISTRELDCLTIMMWSESRGDTVVGMAASATSVFKRKKILSDKLNRPVSVCEVVTQKGQYHGIVHSKFYSDLIWRIKNDYSWYSKLKIRNGKDRSAYANIRAVARKTLKNENRFQKQGIKITHFATRDAAMRQGWFRDKSMRYIGKFGHHVYFYENPQT